jgi:hypothetical protein
MGEELMGMNEEKKPNRMVSMADAMDFATAIARASGWIEDDTDEDLDACHCNECFDICNCKECREDDEKADLARAVANWDAPDPAVIKVVDVPVEYIEVKMFLTKAEAQDWVDLELPPWWASKTVEQVLRKAKATS